MLWQRHCQRQRDVLARELLHACCIGASRQQECKQLFWGYLHEMVLVNMSCWTCMSCWTWCICLLTESALFFMN